MSDESCDSVKWKGVPEQRSKFWSVDLDRHFLGEYSYAVIRGNSSMEDYSEVVIGSDSTFIGVYDGHGGHQTAEFLYENMFDNVFKCIKQHSFLDPEILEEAFVRIENNWVDELEEKTGEELKAASVSGSSCLIGVIWSGHLFIVANVGDSRAVMGCQEEGSLLLFQQLTRDDNLRDPKVRAEVQALHPEPDFIVEDGHGVHRIKGRSELSKSIGDAYLKYEQFNIRKENEPAIVSALNSVPSSIEVEALHPLKGDGERFLIFASHGFWNCIDSGEAAEIVSFLPRKGIAEKLIEKALAKAAVKMERSYEDVLNLKDNNGMKLHDDMTVVVVFFHNNLDQTDIPEQIRVKAGGSNSYALEKIIHVKVRAEEAIVN